MCVDNKKALANRWKEKGLRFDKIIVSPFKRTIQTAEIISDFLNCPVEKDNDWMEMDNGQLKNIAFHETSDGFPIPKIKSLFERLANGKGESYWQLHSRSIMALEKILQQKDGNYLVVAHGGILNAAIRSIVGSQPPVNGNGLYFQFGYLGYIHTEFIPNDNVWIIKEFNSGILT